MICTNLSGQTNFKGGVYSNTTWSKANSPYIITGDVVVFPSKTLTIEPGVEIKFDGNYYFEVRGKLNSIGIVGSPITFTSNKAQPQKSDWIGFIINTDQGGQASYEYTNFNYADVANNIVTQYYPNKATYFSNCIFDQNNTSLLSNAFRLINVNSCVFSNNNFCIRGNDWNIINSSFINNSQGLYESVNNIVKKSVFRYNTHTAIYSYGSTIEDCLIENNDIGIQIDYTGGNEINNNTISGNSIGIQYLAQSFMGDYGISAGSVKNNVISDNLVYNILNGTIQTIDLTGNYWGTTDSTTIEDKLKDGYDDIKLGLINYAIYDNNGTKISSVIKVDYTGFYLGNTDKILSLYPNPVVSELNIEIKEPKFKEIDVTIYNALGQTVYSSKNNPGTMKINLKKLNPGIYIIVLKSGSYAIRKKIIKN